MAKVSFETKKMVGIALITAIVVVLQMVSMSLRFSMFSITLVLVPVVVGAALYGVGAGAWLGLVFGVAVLLTGDAASFLTVSVPGTIITVLLKGMLAGALTGAVYKLFSKKNDTLAVAISAVVCPMVNTGVFLLGCLVFFFDTIKEWAGSESVASYMIFTLVGINFLIELGTNILLAPAAVRIIKIGKKM